MQPNQQYIGTYHLACGGVALLRCVRNNEPECREYINRVVPENEGVIPGDYFTVTVFEESGRQRWDFANVVRPRALEATA